MPLSPSVMRFLLGLCMFGMMLLAAFYLRRRELTLVEYAAWGLLAVCVPLVGPFLVILNHPGRLKAEYRIASGQHTPSPALQFLAARLHRFERAAAEMVAKLCEE